MTQRCINEKIYNDSATSRKPALVGLAENCSNNMEVEESLENNKIKKVE